MTMGNRRRHREIIEKLEDLVIWEEPDASNYFNAFLSNYRVLDCMLEKMNLDFDSIELPRVAYFIYTQDISLIYAQLSITIECLLKMIIFENGYSVKRTHKLVELLEEVGKLNDNTAKEISKMLGEVREVLSFFDDENIFVNYRYGNNRDVLEPIGTLKEIIGVLDNIYEHHFEKFNFIDLTYGCI